MCGICGELRLDNSRPDADVISRMLPAIERRGPDAAGRHSDGPVQMGHRRLSIIDLSDRSAQPMLDKHTDNAIVFNGSIYNYPQLREELQSLGHQFVSSGDTEVILRAYGQWGDDFVSRLSGMFAFAIWDARDKSLLLGRDRMGIKPLYFSHTSDRFRWASNTQALLASGDIDTRIDPIAVHHQLTLHASVPAPYTLMRGIRKLEPGHTLRIKAGEHPRKRRYWQLSAADGEARSDEEWREATHEALRVAVKRRLEIADVPVGVLLSGGLDSSILVGLLAEAGATNLQTFTVGFEDQPEERGDEFEFADMVAEQYGTRHHQFQVPNQDLMRRLPEAVAAMAEPMVGQDAAAFYLLSERVAQEVKVVQSGQGSDEVFGGYFWYPEMHKAEGEDDLTRFSRRYFDRDHSEWLQMIDPEYHTDGDVSSAYVAGLLKQYGEGEYVNRVLAMDTGSLIVDDPVKRVDNMTMAFGLEARVPFLDHELVELVAGMPARLKLGQGGKGILKDISRGIVPDAIIDRPKAYFPVPALKFVRGEVLDFMRDILNADACRQRGLFNRAYVDKLLAEPDQHFTRLQGSKLWHLALLELWMQQHI
ncbi:MAG: N-acetylglutaminylglutamine amidotransferase [Granulosicoccaceae bacterium]